MTTEHARNLLCHVVMITCRYLERQTAYQVGIYRWPHLLTDQDTKESVDWSLRCILSTVRLVSCFGMDKTEENKIKQKMKETSENFSLVH